MRSEIMMKKKSEYVTETFAFSTMSLFQDKYLICCNKSVNIFDISDPEDIKFICSSVQHDFIDSAEVFGEKYLMVSFYTAVSCVFEITWSKSKDNIDIKLRGNDYDWQSPGIFCPIKFDNTKCSNKKILSKPDLREPCVEEIDPSINSPHSFYFVADGHGRLRINQINETPINDDQRYRIAHLARVNYQMDTLYKGFMVKNQDVIGERENGFNLEHIQRNTFIFGSKEGQIGMIQAIPKEVFDKLSKLERAMNRSCTSIGNFYQSDFRNNDPQSDPTEKYEVLTEHRREKRFIDGDFVALFLDFDAPKKKLIERMTDNRDLKVLEGWIKSLSLTSTT